jgi:uncharacterized protein
MRDAPRIPVPRASPVTLLAWALVAAAAVFAFSGWTFWMIVRPPHIAIPGVPADYGLAATDVTLTTADGITLAAWLVPAATTPAPAVVLLHGYPASKNDLLPLAGALHGRFTVLLVDFRSFGESAGRATTLGHRERLDLRAAVDFLAARGDERIGVFGYSLGGAVALLGAAEDARIRAVAAWAPFADLRALGRQVYAILGPLKGPLVRLMVVWSRLVFGADITRPAPEAAASRLTIPVQITASRRDEQIPFEHAERLERALAHNPEAEFHFGQGGHNEPAQGFEARLIAFFARALR